MTFAVALPGAGSFAVQMHDADIPEFAVTVNQPPAFEVLLVEAPAFEVTLGVPGPQGERGPAGGDLSFEYTQGVPSAMWTITHDLNKFPSVTVVDSSGDEVEGSVNYTGRNTVVVTFGAAFSGKAYLN